MNGMANPDSCSIGLVSDSSEWMPRICSGCRNDWRKRMPKRILSFIVCIGSDAVCFVSFAGEPVGCLADKSSLMPGCGIQSQHSPNSGQPEGREEIFPPVSQTSACAPTGMYGRGDHEAFRNKVIDQETVEVNQIGVVMRHILKYDLRTLFGVAFCVYRQAFPRHKDRCWGWSIIIGLRCYFHPFHPITVETHSGSSDVLHPEPLSTFDSFAGYGIAHAPAAEIRHVKVCVHDAALVPHPLTNGYDSRDYRDHGSHAAHSIPPARGHQIKHWFFPSSVGLSVGAYQPTGGGISHEKGSGHEPQ